MKNKKPIILDTDIGTDIDDTWALAMLLNCNELDPKLVLTTTGNTAYRARLVAKLLQIANRTDISVASGLHLSDEVGDQYEWIEDYELSDYTGRIYDDGINALIKTIQISPQPVTIICIGPLTNIAAALDIEPDIVSNAKLICMGGCIDKGYSYGESNEVVVEWNIKQDIPAAQKVFSASWPIILAPMDTCGLIRIKGEKYQRLCKSEKPLIKAILENYRIWHKNNTYGGDPENCTSILWDTEAVYLAFCQKFLVLKEHGIKISDDGYTLIDNSSKMVTCAVGWKDISAFEDLLVDRLICD